MTSIKFGTSGHRGIIGQTFTVNHLRAIVHAIHEYFKYHKIQTPKVLLGYDTRTGNSPTLEVNSYTCCVVSELVSKRIKVDVSDNYMATPITSWAVKTYNYNLGIILTASHNPPNYNGIKINDANGAPASIDITSWIEKKANDIFPSLNDISYKEIPIKKFNFVNYTEPFTDHLRTLIKDQFHLPPIEFNNKYIIIGKNINAPVAPGCWALDRIAPKVNICTDPIKEVNLDLVISRIKNALNKQNIEY